MISEDDLLISRGLAAGWTATVSEQRVPGEGFRTVWVWSWLSPDGRYEHEVTVFPREGLRIVIDDDLRAEFRALAVEPPIAFDLDAALCDLLLTVQHDLRWIINSSSRERAFEVFSIAYKALGVDMPKEVSRRLQTPAFESDDAL